MPSRIWVMGRRAGYSGQLHDAIPVGYAAGESGQGAYAVAVGYAAGSLDQPANTIIINATGTSLNGVAAQTDSFYVAPIRTSPTLVSGLMSYNSTTKEVTYGVRTAPVSSIGLSGDIAGMISFDNTHMYYCTATYDSTSDIWKRVALDATPW